MGLFFKDNYREEMIQKRDNAINDRRAQILIDSMNLIDSTTNPETYFERYKLAGNISCMMGNNPAIIYKGMNAKEICNMLRGTSSKDSLHRQFIDRLFASNRENRLAYHMNDYGFAMSQETRQYFIDKLNGKQFYFCKVKFSDSSTKTYTYITKDRSINVGDTITVPTGPHSSIEYKAVQVHDVFYTSLDKLDFPIENLRCVDSKLRNITCPRCGASITVDIGNRTGKCAYCSAEFYLIS